MTKVYDISNGWPGGISDGLTLDCGICWKHTNFDYTVDDDLWNNIVPEEHKRGVICLDCLDYLAKKYGYILSNHLLKVQYTGTNETIVLVPDISFIYDKK